MIDCLVLGTVGRERVRVGGRCSPVVFGGTGTYATEAILKAGEWNPLLVSPIGYDLIPSQVLNEFSRPIDGSGLCLNDDLPSFYWEADYGDQQETSKTIMLENRLVTGFSPDWLAVAEANPAIQAVYLAAFDPAEQIRCSEAFDGCFILTETLEYWIGRDRSGVLRAASSSDGFIVTQREFNSLWGINVEPGVHVEQVDSVRREMGLLFIGVTFAHRGSWFACEEGSFYAPAIRTLAADPTGAGNAFSGGILSALNGVQSFRLEVLKGAVAKGTALASLQVRDFGNRRLRMSTPSEIEGLEVVARSSIRPTGCDEDL